MKNKGLSLVELLGVLVVITFIFLITVVAIRKIDKDATLTSYKLSAKNYAKSIEASIGEKYAKSGSIPYGRYIVSGKTLININPLMDDIELNIKGGPPTNGFVCISKDGKVPRYTLQFDKYVVSKNNGDQTIKKGNELVDIICDNDENYAAALTISSPDGWASSKAVTIEDNYNTGMQIQYKIGRKGTWTNYDGAFIVRENCTIYAKLNDGVVELAYTTHNVTQIDSVAPKIELIENCSDKPDIYSHFKVTYGESGGTFTCNSPALNPGTLYDLTCTAVSGTGVESVFNGTIIDNKQIVGSSMGADNTYDINEIEQLSIYVRAVSGHTYINNGDDACDSYGDASSSITTYGVKRDGTAEAISAASAGVSVRRGDSSGCNCSASPSTCSGTAGGKCKSRTITYVITDEDRSKYESLYFVASSSKSNPVPCGNNCSIIWPQTSASATRYGFSSYCIEKVEG